MDTRQIMPVYFCMGHEVYDSVHFERYCIQGYHTTLILIKEDMKHVVC